MNLDKYSELFDALDRGEFVNLDDYDVPESTRRELLRLNIIAPLGDETYTTGVLFDHWAEMMRSE